MPLNVKLVVVGGDVKTTEIKLRLPSTIGRGRGTTIVLPHPLVSRQHCELFEVDGQLMVRDLGSLNGTFVNNERVTEAALAAGELLTVGTVTFRAVYESDAALPPGSGPKLKGSEKTVPVTKTTTRAAAAKAPAPKKDIDDSAPLEFDFGQPESPDDEEEVRPTERGSATPVTERLDATVANRATQAAASKPAKGAAKPAAGKPSPAAKPADATVNDPKRKKKGEADEEEDKVAGASDEDLTDFLNSLGDK